MSKATISRCNYSLEKKGCLEGASDSIKRFQLRDLNQLFIWKFKEQDDKIQQNSNDIAELKKEMQRLLLINEELQKQINTKPIYTL